MKEEAYQSIACGQYDLLEIAAMRKQLVTIEYMEAKEVLSIKDRIVDLYNNKNGEFLKLKDNDVSIRLDRIVRLDGKDFGGYCSI